MLAVWLGTFALVVVFLPPRFDIAIYLKERQSNWPNRSIRYPLMGTGFAFIVASLVTIFV